MGVSRPIGVPNRAMRAFVIALLVGVLALAAVAEPAGARKRKKRAQRIPATLVVRGEIGASNPFSVSTQTITESEFLWLTCPYLPTTQGLDGYVVPLPPIYARVGSKAMVHGDDASGLLDPDLRFYDENCEFVGGSAEAGAREIAQVPRGTRFIVVNVWMGVSSSFRLTVAPAGYQR